MPGDHARPPAPSAPGPCAPPSALARAEQFVWLTARVLEQRRFAFHFLGGDADAVDTALGAYLNADGGYGHALDPDVRGPLSQPLHGAHALRVLDGLGRCAGQRVERRCRHLSRVSTPDGALPVVLPGPRAYPAAPYHPVREDARGELATTGRVVGLLHRNRVWHAWLFRATDFCWARVERPRPWHPYEVPGAVAFLDGAPDRARAAAAADRLGRLVRERRLVVLDPARRREAAGVPGAELVHGRGAGPFAGLPGRPAAPGRRLAGAAPGVGAGQLAGAAAHRHAGGAADPAGVRTAAGRRYPPSARTPAVTTTAAATTTRNGARSSRASPAAARPAARASTTSA